MHLYFLVVSQKSSDTNVQETESFPMLNGLLKWMKVYIRDDDNCAVKCSFLLCPSHIEIMKSYRKRQKHRVRLPCPLASCRFVFIFLIKRKWLV